MSRTQIGYALQYKQPQHSVLMIHQRHKERMDRFSVEVRASQFVTPYFNKDKNASVFMYSERGIYEVCRWSNQKVSDDFHDWVYEMISQMAKNGYYIVSEKDSQWISIRHETKQVRRMETDTIKKFVEYAKDQGSTHADTYYMNFTKLVQNHLGIDSGGRDDQDQKELLRLKSLETIVDMHLETLMKEQMPYKDVYNGVKNLIQSI